MFTTLLLAPTSICNWLWWYGIAAVYCLLVLWCLAKSLGISKYKNSIVMLSVSKKLLTFLPSLLTKEVWSVSNYELQWVEILDAALVEVKLGPLKVVLNGALSTLLECSIWKSNQCGIYWFAFWPALLGCIAVWGEVVPSNQMIWSHGHWDFASRNNSIAIIATKKRIPTKVPKINSSSIYGSELRVQFKFSVNWIAHQTHH